MASLDPAAAFPPKAEPPVSRPEDLRFLTGRSHARSVSQSMRLRVSL